jgi:hypothetical protein
MTDITGSVLGVQGRHTRSQKLIYDVAFSDGVTYSTFDPDLATKCQGLMGQQATARVEVSQKVSGGKTFTNYNIHDIAPAGQLPAMTVPQAPGTPYPAGTPVPVVGAPSAPAPGIPIAPPTSNGGRGGGGGMTLEDKRRIAFMSAASTAATLVGSLFSGAGPEAMAEMEEEWHRLTMATFRQAFVQSQEPSAAPVAAAPAPVAVTPEEVAAGVNAEQPGAVAVGAAGAGEGPAWD